MRTLFGINMSQGRLEDVTYRRVTVHSSRYTLKKIGMEKVRGVRSYERRFHRNLL
jgi:hypothetical protein